MKHLQQTRISLLLLFCFATGCTAVSAQDSAATQPSVKLGYYVNNNSIQYLLVQSRIKAGRKFQPVPRQAVRLYLDTNNAGNLVARITTDETGQAKVIIPPALKGVWSNGPKHSFIAVMEAPSPGGEITTSLEINRAKIVMDTSTSDGVHTINVQAMFLENNNWVPAKDVEMKVGIIRSTTVLSAGDEATYTTDSAGFVNVEFKKDKLPGDQDGNFILAAQVEDNDQYGNLLVEKKVPWGVAVKPERNFLDQRTLWSTRFRTPWWLLFLAYSIVITVWGTIIYLVMQIIKIKKLGAEDS